MGGADVYIGFNAPNLPERSKKYTYQALTVKLWNDKAQRRHIDTSFSLPDTHSLFDFIQPNCFWTDTLRLTRSVCYRKTLQIEYRL